MNDVVILAPNGKFTESDIKLSKKSQKELDDLKEELNLPDIAEKIRC